MTRRMKRRFEEADDNNDEGAYGTLGGYNLHNYSVNSFVIS